MAPFGDWEVPNGFAKKGDAIDFNSYNGGKTIGVAYRPLLQGKVMRTKKKNTKVTITAISAAVIVVFLVLFTKTVRVDFTAPFVHLKLAGTNEGTSAGVKAKGLDAGGNIQAQDKGGQGVAVEDAKAKGDITLVNEAPSGGTTDPKP